MQKKTPRFGTGSNTSDVVFDEGYVLAGSVLLDEGSVAPAGLMLISVPIIQRAEHREVSTSRRSNVAKPHRFTFAIDNPYAY